jgi:hypothetical protein
MGTSTAWATLLERNWKPASNKRFTPSGRSPKCNSVWFMSHFSCLLYNQFIVSYNYLIIQYPSGQKMLAKIAVLSASGVHAFEEVGSMSAIF